MISLDWEKSPILVGLFVQSEWKCFPKMFDSSWKVTFDGSKAPKNGLYHQISCFLLAAMFSEGYLRAVGVIAAGRAFAYCHSGTEQGSRCSERLVVIALRFPKVERKGSAETCKKNPSLSQFCCCYHHCNLLTLTRQMLRWIFLASREGLAKTCTPALSLMASSSSFPD